MLSVAVFKSKCPDAELGMDVNVPLEVYCHISQRDQHQELSGIHVEEMPYIGAGTS